MGNRDRTVSYLIIKDQKYVNKKDRLVRYIRPLKVKDQKSMETRKDCRYIGPLF